MSRDNQGKHRNEIEWSQRTQNDRTFGGLRVRVKVKVSMSVEYIQGDFKCEGRDELRARVTIVKL